MNYEPNTRHWEVGDLVIHDYDAKQPRMLMRVVRYTPSGEVVTRYADPDDPLRRGTRSARRLWQNHPRYLHDPARFGIAVPAGPIAAGTG